MEKRKEKTFRFTEIERKIKILGKCKEKQEKKESLTLMGDFNAQIGKDEKTNENIGGNLIHEKESM